MSQPERGLAASISDNGHWVAPILCDFNQASMVKEGLVAKSVLFGAIATTPLLKPLKSSTAVGSAGHFQVLRGLHNQPETRNRLPGRTVPELVAAKVEVAIGCAVSVERPIGERVQNRRQANW